MVFDQSPLAVVGLAILCVVVFTAHSKMTAKPDLVSSLPWVGMQGGFLSGVRTRLASLGSMVQLLEEGYRKYSSSGSLFVLPAFDESWVLLPPSEVKWLVDQPEQAVDGHKMQREILQTDYSCLDASLARDPIHAIVIRRELTRNLGSLIPDIEDELDFGVDLFWGSDAENWKDVPVFSTMEQIVARTSNRLFVGLPLCRNSDFLYYAGKFAQAIPLSGSLIRVIPAVLRPLLAWIIVLPNRWYFRNAARHLIPVVKERIADFQSGGETQNNFLAWYLKEIADHPNPREKTPEMIAKRMMIVNFAAIHTSTFTATNLLFDLFSSPRADEYVQGLREEIEQALGEHDGEWDKQTLAKLIKTDSVVRESLRVSTFLSHGLDRLVVDPHGVTMNDGTNIPPGTRICAPVYSIHHDENFYENPKTYDAFRFSKAREDALASEKADGDSNGKNAAGGAAAHKKNLGKVLESKNLATVTTSETFLSFSHGRHACPGRFFAATEMKLLLAYIVMNYDIKPLASRPQNSFIAGNILPPMTATISVRRRKL